MATIKGRPMLSENLTAFNAEEVVKETVDVVMQKITSESTKEHIHWAPTQSGKSAFKAVKICVYLTMNIPVIVITKGKKESEELQGKIRGYLKGCKFKKKIFSAYGNEEHIKTSFKNDKEASALVIPDTHQRIQFAHDLLSNTMTNAKRRRRRIAGCALILDEVDAITDRSEDKDQRNEKGLNNLIKDLKPYIVKVTATPIPVFSKYLDQKPIITTSNESIENYVGVKDMILFDDLDQDSVNDGFGNEVSKFSPRYVCANKRECEKAALFPKGSRSSDKLQLKNVFPNVWNKKNPIIPRFNSQCIKLQRRELDKKNSRGMLSLVDTCPWVDRDKNLSIFHQASGLQDYFFSLGRRELIAIVVHAENIFYRLPGHSYSFQCRRTLGELIDKIDSIHGLKMPVVVFGYYAMKRSRSFRSSKRVPTSMIMSLGDGQSNENCRQAAGRVTFRGLDVIRRNRNTSKVWFLCPKTDFEVVQKYDPLVLEMIQLYKEQDMSYKDIYSELVQSSDNFYLADSKRRTGNYVPGQRKKGQKGKGTTTTSKSLSKESTNTIGEDSAVGTATSDQTLDDDLSDRSPQSLVVKSSKASMSVQAGSGDITDEIGSPQALCRNSLVASNAVPTQEQALTKDTPEAAAEEIRDRRDSSSSNPSDGTLSIDKQPSEQTFKAPYHQRRLEVTENCISPLGKRKDSSEVATTKIEEIQARKGEEHSPKKLRTDARCDKLIDMAIGSYEGGAINLVDGDDEDGAIDLTLND
jgi:hypothetical protein